MRPDQSEKCSIEHVGKQRNGKPRYWCKVHQRSATGLHGVRLSICVGALEATRQPKVLELDAQAHPGGIALWGAVEAVYDSSSIPPEIGIHVHARATKDGQKEVDDTFDTVVVKLSATEQATISGDTAISFYLSRFLNREIKLLRCPHCKEAHLDAGYFAIKPHRKHMCQACGRHFNDSEKSISNPVALLQVVQRNVSPVRAPRNLDVQQSSYPGGIQIWASNPALVWTSDRPEEAGLHIHLYDSHGNIAVDDTYDHVVIDSIELNEEHIQYFMAQQALPHLSDTRPNHLRVALGRRRMRSNVRGRASCSTGQRSNPICRRRGNILGFISFTARCARSRRRGDGVPRTLARRQVCLLLRRRQSQKGWCCFDRRESRRRQYPALEVGCRCGDMYQRTSV
jgi:transposase-like protein